MKKSKGYKNYNMNGQIVGLHFKSIMLANTYPFEYEPVKVKIVAEYPLFLRCEVQPHWNKYGLGKARPYEITIHKHDLYTGLIYFK